MADGLPDWDVWGDVDDPRDGPAALVRFVAEGLLGIYIWYRTTTHVIATAIVYPDAHPYKLSYRLELGWAVAEPRLSRANQLTASTVAALLLLWTTTQMPIESVAGPPPLRAMVWANWGGLLVDPLVVVAGWLREADDHA